MKKIIALLFFNIFSLLCFAQVLIHSHNDYEQAAPFHLAYENRVYQIEADVFEINGELIVSHTKKAINSNNTLERLYFKPIDSLFKVYKGRVSKSRKYRFNLMIDFKTEWKTTYSALQKLVEKYSHVFDRAKNKKAISIIISGNRPPDTSYHTYPRWIFFDGLPNVKYNRADFAKVVMISENFKTYSKWTGVGQMPELDRAKLQALVWAGNKTHRYVRFWGAPDTPECWRELSSMGRVIINTDKIRECKTFFEQQ